MSFFHEGSSLKEKIEEARNRIQKGIDYLKRLENDLNKRDSEVWNEIIRSLKDDDSMRASSLANELSEIRKLKKIVQSKKQDLEIAHSRLLLVKELEDIVKTLNPISETLKDISKAILDSSIPNALNDIWNSIGIDVMMREFPIFCSEDAEKILNEAAMIAKLKKENA